MSSDKEYLNEVIKTIPNIERELTLLAEVFDKAGREQDNVFLNTVHQLSVDAGQRLKTDEYTELHHRVADLSLLFGTNHVRLRMANNIADALREKINGKA